MATFLELIPTTCPHDLFRREDGARSSQLESSFIDPARLIVVEKQNAATEMASLILPAVGSNLNLSITRASSRDNCGISNRTADFNKAV